MTIEQLFQTIPPELAFFLCIGILLGVVLGRAISKPKKPSTICPLPDEVILNLVTKKFQKALLEKTYDSYKNVVLKLYDDYEQYRSVARQINEEQK